MVAVEEWLRRTMEAPTHTALNARSKYTCTLNPLQFKEAVYFF